MERSAASVSVSEAIPTPVRVIGWLSLLSLVLVLVIDGPGLPGQLRAVIDENLEVLGLGAGVAPLEFLAFAWVMVAMLFWAQARARGESLGRKSGLVMTASLATQALLLVMMRTA